MEEVEEVPWRDDLISCLEERETCEDTISWQWVEVTADGRTEPGNTSTTSSTFSSSSSEITELIFLENNFYSSTMTKSSKSRR